MAGSQGPKTKKEKKSPSLVKNRESSRLDLKKINQLREAIREGRYEVDFEKLAEKFLKDL